MLAITNHNAMRRIQTFLLQQVSQKIYFVAARHIQLAAIGLLKQAIHFKMSNDFFGINPRLGSANEQAISTVFGSLKEFNNPLIALVFIKTDSRKTLPIQANALEDQLFIFCIQKLAERFCKRRPDNKGEVFSWRNIAAKLFKRILNARYNADKRVCQRSIQIKKQSAQSQILNIGIGFAPTPYSNSMITASTARLSPGAALIALTTQSRSARSTFSIFMASTMASCSPAFTSCPSST